MKEKMTEKFYQQWVEGLPKRFRKAAERHGFSGKVTLLAIGDNVVKARALLDDGYRPCIIEVGTKVYSLEMGLADLFAGLDGSALAEYEDILSRARKFEREEVACYALEILDRRIVQPLTAKKSNTREMRGRVLVAKLAAVKIWKESKEAK